MREIPYSWSAKLIDNINLQLSNVIDIGFKHLNRYEWIYMENLKRNLISW